MNRCKFVFIKLYKSVHFKVLILIILKDPEIQLKWMILTVFNDADTHDKSLILLF